MRSTVAATIPGLLLAAVSTAQSHCLGNGIANAYLRSTPAVIGGTMTADFGSAQLPNGAAFLAFSGGIGPTPVPGVGTLCLDLAPHFAARFFVLDGAGNAHFATPVANVPGTVNYAPFFLGSAVLAPAGIGLSKSTRLQWEMPDSFDLLPVTATPRSLHTATALFAGSNDNRQDVLIAGGGAGSILSPVVTASTLVFQPLTRTFRPGPSLSLPRVGHAAVRLNDGRVLLTGGATTGGVGTASCDIYDPVTDSITPAAPMGAPRLGHAITLLGNGRVFVSGGFADWQNAATQFAARCNTAQDTSETWNPATNAWTPGPVMSSRRAGHTHTTLLDGRVLIVGGVNGGQVIIATPNFEVPTFAGTCDFFDPATGLLSPAPSGPSVGYHGATLVPGGDVVVTGGAFQNHGNNGLAECGTTCYRLQGGAWTAAPSLPIGVAFHTQISDPATGLPVVLGGFTGQFGFLPATAQAGAIGLAFQPGRSIGEHAFFTGQQASPRAGHTCTRLQDGTFLVFGGQSPDPVTSTVITRADGFVYVR
jgi:hypothetical protein